MHKIIMAVTIEEMLICPNFGVRSFRDGNQGISKYKDSNMGQVAGFQGRNYPQVSFLNLYMINATMNKLSALRTSHCVSVCFLFRLLL